MGENKVLLFSRCLIRELSIWIKWGIEMDYIVFICGVYYLLIRVINVVLKGNFLEFSWILSC